MVISSALPSVSRVMAVVVALGLPAGLLPSTAVGAVTAPYVQTGTVAAAPGVEQRWGTAASHVGPVVVQMAQIDPADPGIRFRTSLPKDMVNGRETTTGQALRYSGEGHRVVAAINGPTFFSYPGTHLSARGLNVQDGEITSANPRPGGLTAFAVDRQGHARIGRPTMDVRVSLPDGTVGTIDRINAGRLPGESALFTPRFDTHTWTGTDGDEYVLSGASLPLRPVGVYAATVAQIRRGQGDTSIGAGQLVLSASGAKAAAYAGLAVGDTVTISIKIEDGWTDTFQSIGARQSLVTNGAVDIVPYDEEEAKTPNPHSAIGVKANGKVLLVVAEGRTTASAGLLIGDLAELMISLGAVDAINLDGGGSSTLAIRQQGDVEVSVVNRLSGGGTTPPGQERAISNTLQVVSEYPTGSLQNLVVEPAVATLAVGQSQQFLAKGYDAYFNGVAPGQVSWTVRAGVTISAGGVLTAQATGDFSVTASASGITRAASLTVMVPPKPTTPTGVAATTAPGRVVNVSWARSTSPIAGTITYRIFRDGVAVGLRQAGLTYTDTPSAGVHKYQVRAVDAVGTRSNLSTAVTVQVYDKAPAPTVPTGVTATAAEGGAINVSWNASVAYVPGAVTYRLFRDGTAIGLQTSALSFSDAAPPGTHRYQVRAIDAAKSRSALSTYATATTLP